MLWTHTHTSKTTQASESLLQGVLKTNAHSQTHLELWKAPAGVLLWRESLLVSCRVTINRMESLSFSFKRLCCRKQHHCLPLPTHTHTETLKFLQTAAGLCVCACVFVIRACPHSVVLDFFISELSGSPV